MGLATNRIVNGLLKGLGSDTTPEALEKVLTQDIEIVALPSRSTERDLWPAIWALAAIAERQFFGRVYLRVGLMGTLHAPAALGSRCIFTDKRHDIALSIGLGVEPSNTAARSLIVDARAGGISIGALNPPASATPTPVECFALAGYAGFAALATLVGLTEHRQHLAKSELWLPTDPEGLMDHIRTIDGFSVVGLGQLGQAYLALLFFLGGGDLSGKRIALIDKDSFESENGRTQILLSEGVPWLNEDKGKFIAGVVKSWGAIPLVRPYKLDWEIKRAVDDPPIALVGVHDLEGRRIALAAGFSRIIDAGVGTDLLVPRVSWHSLSGGPRLARRIFPERPILSGTDVKAEWAEKLINTPGKCGWVEFMGISATAPCLGIAASAYAISELISQRDVSGRAILWSPCLPPLREVIENS